MREIACIIFLFAFGCSHKPCLREHSGSIIYNAKTLDHKGFVDFSSFASSSSVNFFLIKCVTSDRYNYFYGFVSDDDIFHAEVILGSGLSGEDVVKITFDLIEELSLKDGEVLPLFISESTNTPGVIIKEKLYTSFDDEVILINILEKTELVDTNMQIH